MDCALQWPAEQWVKYYNGTVSGADMAVALTIDTSGHIIVTGTSAGSFNTADFTTVKYDADGDTIWTARYDPAQVGFGPREAIALTVDKPGNVYVTGTVLVSGQEENFATVKYNASGVEQWVGLYNGPHSGEDRPNAIAVDDSGNEMRVLEDELFATGTYSVSWNGIDKWGHAVASGVYFVQMRAGAFVAVRKIALVR